MGSKIALRWRENGERKEETVDDFKAYFYISTFDSWNYNKLILNKYGKKSFIAIEWEEGDWRSIEGIPLKKLIYHNPKDRWNIMTELHKKEIKTFQADVDIKRLYAVDRMAEIKEYEHRKWYFLYQKEYGNDMVS